MKTKIYISAAFLLLFALFAGTDANAQVKKARKSAAQSKSVQQKGTLAAYAYFTKKVYIGSVLDVTFYVAPQTYRLPKGSTYNFAPIEITKNAETVINAQIAKIHPNGKITRSDLVYGTLEVAKVGSPEEGMEKVLADFKKIHQDAIKLGSHIEYRIVLIDPQSGEITKEEIVPKTPSKSTRTGAGRAN